MPRRARQLRPGHQYRRLSRLLPSKRHRIPAHHANRNKSGRSDFVNGLLHGRATFTMREVARKPSFAEVAEARRLPRTADQGGIAPGCGRLLGAVLPHVAVRPARRFAEAFPVQCGHFPERWRPFSGALRTRSGRQPHLLRTFRSDRARDSAHSVRKFPLRPRIFNMSGNLTFSGISQPNHFRTENPYRALWTGALFVGRAQNSAIRQAGADPKVEVLVCFRAGSEGSGKQWRPDAVRSRQPRARRWCVLASSRRRMTA